MYGTYGLPPVPLTYAEFFSLWLNTERVRARGSFDAARSSWVALGREPLPDPWITAAAEGDESRWRLWSLRSGLSRS